MIGPPILDTGPLVAFLNRRDRHHEWATRELQLVPSPLLTCEAVLSEACFLLRHFQQGSGAVLELVKRGLIRIPFRAESEAERLGELIEAYADLPISFADACLVRMAELFPHSSVWTTDGHFRVYRKNGRSRISLVEPA